MKLVVQTLIGLGILLVFCSHTAVGWRSFKVIFTTFPFQANADLVDVKLQVQNDTGDTALNVHLNFLEDVDDVTLRYAIALEANEGNYTALINRSVNFCKFTKQRSIDPILKLLYEDLLKQSNFIKTCPIKKGAYYLRDYRIDEEMLPSYVPETNFFVSLQMDLASGVNIVKGRLNGRIDKSKGFNNLKMFSLG